MVTGALPEPILRSASGRLEATFRPASGMTCTSLRHDGAELLGRECTIADPALRAAMTGIPLMHPWANRLTADRFVFAGREARVPADGPFVPRDGSGRAIHGLLAPPTAWRAAVADGAGALHAELDFGGDAERARAFPFPHRLCLDVTLTDDELSVATSVTPTGETPVPIAFGFHPYLRLPGRARSRWQVTLPAMSRIATAADLIPTGKTDPYAGGAFTLGDSALDVGYIDVPQGSEFVVEDGERALALRLDAGYSVGHVYAPLTDDVICFEPMTAPPNALVSGWRLPSVAPGESYEARFTIAVR
jgi:galactose mutarotase-like enzyme